MRRYWLGVAAATFLSACSGGNPWLDDGGDGGDGTTPTIPAELLGDLESFTYDPVAKTLVVRGISLDNTPIDAVYTRKPGLDVPGYEAYTTQAGALKRHATAYVQERDGARAAVIVTGGLFGQYFGGGSYSRTGAFDPPAVTEPNKLVEYAGDYVGLLNIAGDDGDLLQVAPGTDDDVRPDQAAEVTGSVQLIADFASNVVEGRVYDRIIVDQPTIDLSGQNIDLASTEILADGTFTGDATQIKVDKGGYGGVFGGTDASAVAGTLFVEGHIDGISDIEEYGLFVLSQCGTANADPICNQPTP
jgi:hypothetical protein